MMSTHRSACREKADKKIREILNDDQKKKLDQLEQEPHSDLQMLRGEFRQFSVERPLRFLVALDQDVEIVVKPHRDRNHAPALQVF